MASSYIALALTATFFCLFLTHSTSKSSKESSKFVGKTIETNSGDIYNCIDFYKQPAFSHPLLQNHSFHPKMRPSSRPKRPRANDIFSTHRSEQISMDHIRFNYEGCPPGTVPIRRISNCDRFQTQLPQYFPTSGVSSNKDNNSQSNTYFALAQSPSDPTKVYYGVGASLSIYNPRVKPSQSSSGEIILRSGTDVIIVGWTVNPGVYKDTQTRFFIYAVAQDMHCFNSQCGFISVREDIPLDFVMSSVSKRGGKTYIIKLFVYQDANNGNWWLEIGENGTIVGFWPQKIFGGLQYCASYLACGGEASTTSDLPEIGSGYFPTSYSARDSFCKDIVAVDDGHKVVFPDRLEKFCNDLHYSIWGKDNRFIIYGGPKV